jgi:alpha-glucosidase (family GH31 glycosyl hydrolase)
VLVTDTDFKSPSTWDGWEIDTSKFPDPKAFFDWSASQGLHNTLNIHPSIVTNDPQFPQAQATAKGGLTQSGGSYVFDWGNPDQLKAYLDLHQTMEQQGADFWWLDWCCDGSYSSLPGVTPDAWINQQYADDTSKLVGRGFAFSRAFGSLQAGGYSGQEGLPTGPWADKRTTVHFTGDTTSNWATLKWEVGYTPGESASTGLSAVSHDIGGFNNDGTQTTGGEPGSTKEADDLYARWVQFGTFQPIDRLHGNHSDRLPWQYGPEAKASAEKFFNLRENLVPYTYTLAEQANRTGIPMVRPLYLQYPEQQDAYAQDGAEYLYGPDVLVAPVTTPGTTATTSVWFPPGSNWTDYFTGQTYTGGTTHDITTDLGSMPVFLKSGGIMTTRTDNVTNDVQNSLTKVTVTSRCWRCRPLLPVRGQRVQHERGSVRHHRHRLRRAGRQPPATHRPCRWQLPGPGDAAGVGD